MRERSIELGPDTGSRTNLIVDSVPATALALFLTAVTYSASADQPSRRPFDLGTAVLVITAAGALALRRRRPVAVMFTVFGIILAYFALGYANGPIWIALIIAYFTAVVRGHRLAAAITALAGSLSFRGSTTCSGIDRPPRSWP